MSGRKSISAFLLFFALAVCAYAQEPVNAGKMKFHCSTDKSPVAYMVNDSMTFTMTLDYGQEFKNNPNFYVRWTRSGDDGNFSYGFSPIAPGNPVTVKTTIDRPGFVYVRAELVDVYGRTFRYFNKDIMHYHAIDAGAGADVDKILPANKEPADFVEYWQKQRAILDKVPVVPVMKPLDEKFIPKKYLGKFDVWEVTIPCAAPRPVTGHLIIPKDAKPGSLGAQVSFDGYGPGAQGAPPAAWQYEAAVIDDASRQLKIRAALEGKPEPVITDSPGRIVFKINAHGYELGREDQYYKDFFAQIPNYAFTLEENKNPDTSYFNGMAMRVMRAFDFVKTLPQWNKKELIAQGGSQGGLQTTWAGFLVPELTICRPHVTWCADINGTSVGRLGGWRPAYMPGLDYYDVVFHTRHIPETCLLDINRIGLGDYVCPPSGVAAQYNAANCPKQVTWYQGSTHMFIPVGGEKYFHSEPAGKGINGEAAPMQDKPREKVQFVSAEFLPDQWLFAPDASEDILKCTEALFQPVKFSGRENLRLGRGENGKDLPVMRNVCLRGVLEADADGYALIGTGADWWWNCAVKIDGKWQSVFARTMSQGANGSAAFSPEDWIYRVPVKKGKNEILLQVTLGEQGFVAIDTLDPAGFADREISRKTYDSFLFFRDKYKAPLKKISKFRRAGACNEVLVFETPQPYPAGIEYRKAGEKDWKVAWDPTLSTTHSVRIEPLSMQGASLDAAYEFRIVQHCYEGGWKLVRTESVLLSNIPLDRNFAK